jgi:hypothetical protein
MPWSRAPQRSKVCAAAAALLAAALIAACAGSGYTYVKNGDDHTYFKVPDNWKLYDEDSIVHSLNKTLSKREQQAAIDQGWQVGFDASSRPSLKHLLSGRASDPEGVAIVSPLSNDEQDSMSLQAMRNTYIQIDAALQANAAEIQTYEPVALDGGFHGMHVVVTIDAKAGSTTVDQTSVVDQDTTKIYTLIVSCSTSCYNRNQDRIDNIVKSWTVRDH